MTCFDALGTKLDSLMLQGPGGKRSAIRRGDEAGGFTTVALDVPVYAQAAGRANNGLESGPAEGEYLTPHELTFPKGTDVLPGDVVLIADTVQGDDATWDANYEWSVRIDGRDIDDLLAVTAYGKANPKAAHA